MIFQDERLADVFSIVHAEFKPLWHTHVNRLGSEHTYLLCDVLYVCGVL